MANIRINSLPADAAPNAADVVPIDGLTTRKATLTNLINAGRPFASQAEAEAGTSATVGMNPLATAQAIAAQGGAAFAASARGVPAGGTVNQVLGKTGSGDYAMSWRNAGAGDLISVNNLADVANAATALSNLGGLNATLAASTYLTQTAAASTYQPIGSFQPLASNLTSWAGVTRAAGYDTFASGPTSANLKTLMADETGSGSLVFATSPTLVTPALGTPSALVLTNATGLPIAGGGTGASAADAARLNLVVPTYVADMTALLALDATKDKVADIYAAGGQNGKFAWRSSDLSPLLLGSAITSTAVNSTTEVITKVAHTLKTADAVITTTAVNGLSLNTIYWVIFVDVDNFKLASSRALAIAGTAFNLTGTTNFSVKRHADPARIVYAYPASDVSGAAGAWVRQRTDLKVYPEWAGAAHDGTTDDQIAFQAVANLCAAFGGNIGLSSGKYLISSSVVIDYTGHTIILATNNKTVNIMGEGSGNTQLIHSGFTGPMFDIRGKIVSAGVTTKHVFQGFAITYTTLGLGTGMKLDNLAYSMFIDVAMFAMALHIDATDCLSSSFHGCKFTYGVRGLKFQYADFSRPNALSFHGCAMGGQNENVLEIIGGAAITMFGGSVEGFGVSGTDPNRAAIRLTNPCVEGGVALALYGTHIEANQGLADIFVNHTAADPITIILDGCDINRGSGLKTTYNLLVQQNASTTGKVTVVARSSFRHFSGYTPDVNEPAIRFISDPACEYDVDVSGSYFGDPLYRWGEGPKATHARVRFIGATAVLLSSAAVKSVSRTSAGLYVITLRNAMKGSNPIVTAMGSGLVTVPYLVSSTATTVTIQCLNLAGAATDPTHLSVEIKDS